MKQNIPLQTSLTFSNYGHRAYYKALMLLAGLTNSPAIDINPAIAAVVGKRAIPGFDGVAATPAVTAAANTTGYAIGARSAGRPAVAGVPASDGYAAVIAIPAIAPSPAYAIGVPVPLFPVIPARPAQALVVPVTAVAKISTPAVVAIKGFADAVKIIKTATSIDLEVVLPVYQSSKLAGSTKLMLGEITSSALQATAWLDTPASLAFPCGSVPNPDLAIDSMETAFYKDAVKLGATITDVIKDVAGVLTACKKIELTLEVERTFNPLSNLFQLDKVFKDELI